MLAFIGFVMAAQTTGKNPIAALQEHLADVSDATARAACACTRAACMLVRVHACGQH